MANWPGVTVEKIRASKYHGEKFKLVDLPGIYSLTSYTMEEKLTREFILESNVDVIINVVDASSLERNHILHSYIELGKPVIVALNMMDIIEEKENGLTYTDCLKCWGSGHSRFCKKAYGTRYIYACCGSP